MTQTISKKKSPIVRIVKTIGIILLTPIILVILLVALYFGTKPIFDKFDHDKFTTLDTQMQKVYQELKTVSKGADEWKYKALCDPDYDAWRQTGSYNCLVSISTRKNITSVGQLNDLQTKYYPVINGTDLLSTKSQLDSQLPNDFGKKFVVSGAEKDYIEKKSGIGCRYSILLHQSADYRTRPARSDSYSSELIGGVGDATISLRCEETARKSWFPKASDLSQLIPE